jgi:acetyl-CoA acetyltransferase
MQRPKEVQWERAAVSGIGQTEFSKDSGRPVISLASEACLSAIEDAGLTPSDIDGMVTFTQDQNQESALMDNLGIPELTWTGRSNGGGMASVPIMQMAAMAVLTGAATNVLIYRAFNERSEQRFGQPMRPPPGAPAGAARGGPAGPRPPAAMFLNTPASMYALWYQRYMSVYGVTNEDLGRYTVVARKHAATNPNAWFYNRPITLEDHQNSRWIVEPVLRLLDCCQESDGGVAMVITTTERAKDGPNPPAKFLSIAQGWQKAANAGLGYNEGDLSRFPDCRVAGRQTFRDAGLKPDDIDALMIYENFTPLVFLTLEELGFCGPGEAKDFIREGNIELDGKLPLNTHGGLLGEAYIHGVNNNLEAVRQIRGTAANQVQGAEHVMVSNGVGGAIFGKG